MKKIIIIFRSVLNVVNMRKKFISVKKAHLKKKNSMYAKICDFFGVFKFVTTGSIIVLSYLAINKTIE